ncbi:uncharacterized protein EV422DRAFT_313322 [Fimicolochytrium jonesii]|uniref:uncharacterized protein n=1 Tax=Fimicolochytrium jonesii TaxID=1396493 RepID=UPI0022FF41C9|nr:uncharacterized protein EV422DRAFT_313322 [Fimicolochytrium jonesii]KAI8824262.1 hypothetical protein EV422DRAFT_313322 [Fimicolochytrium jonesii]
MKFSAIAVVTATILVTAVAAESEGDGCPLYSYGCKHFNEKAGCGNVKFNEKKECHIVHNENRRDLIGAAWCQVQCAKTKPTYVRVYEPDSEGYPAIYTPIYDITTISKKKKCSAFISACQKACPNYKTKLVSVCDDKLALARCSCDIDKDAYKWRPFPAGKYPEVPEIHIDY